MANKELSIGRFLLIVFVFLCAGVITGCNGGGGSSGSEVTLPSDSDDPSTPISDPDTPNSDPQTIQLSGVNFSPYKDNQDPNFGSFISQDQIRERLEAIKGYANCVRTFGTSSGIDEIPRIAQEMRFCVAAGAWLDENLATNDQEIQRLIDIGLAGHANYLIVGSETLLRGDLTEDQLIGYIEQVKTDVPGVPVTTGEVYPTWIDHPNLVDAVDVLLANYYPYWEGISIDLAMSAVHLYHQDVILASDGKEVIVSETGWPSDGNTIGNAVPSPENAGLYLLNFVSWAEVNNIQYFYFESFDEPWKAKQEGPQGAHWGIWDRDGVLKPEMLPVFRGERMADNWSGGEQIPGGLGNPFIAFTFVPPINSFENLLGQVLHVKPSLHGVVVYIRVSGNWWVKPLANRPLTTIAFDGSFITDITTGGIDQKASEIIAFLVHRDYQPPVALGWSSLPSELWENALAHVQVTR